MARVHLVAALCACSLALPAAHAAESPGKTPEPPAANSIDELIAMVQEAETDGSAQIGPSIDGTAATEANVAGNEAGRQQPPSEAGTDGAAPSEPAEAFSAADRRVHRQRVIDVAESLESRAPRTDYAPNPYVAAAYQDDALPTPPVDAPQPAVADGVPADVAVDGEEVGPVFVHEDGTPIAGDIMNFCGSWCRSGLYFGVEGTFLAPIAEPYQRVVLTDLVTGSPTSGRTKTGLGAGVRTWVGLQNHGWGARVRYWHFGDDTIDVDPDVPINATPTIEEAFYLRADVVDVELTQRFHLVGHQIDTSFGARYADLERNSTVVGYGDVGNGTSLYALAMGANEIEGYGFTTSIGSRFPLWCLQFLRCGGCIDDCVDCGPRCGRFFGFWNFRGSVLWADSTVSALADASAVTNNVVSASAFARNKASASRDHSETVGIVEIQLGVEYQRPLACLPAIAFLRAGFEYQHWETGDLLAVSDSFAFLQGGPPSFGGRAEASAIGSDGDLDLIGFVLGAGLTY